MKKSFILALIILVLFSTSYAVSKKISVVLNRTIKIEYNNAIKEFKNVNGVKVYPISYEGTTYLPIRSISSLINTRIKWDASTQSIFLNDGELDTTSAQTISTHVQGVNENIFAYQNEDIKIYYNNQLQTFRDVNNNIVYPISYNGTTYLPIRAISNLFGFNIDWDGNTKTVSIKNMTNNVITIPGSKVNVSEIRLSKTSLEMVKGSSEILSYTIVPTNATNKNVSWTSSNSNVASIANGKVTALNEGNAVISVQTVDGNKVASCNVIVKSSTDSNTNNNSNITGEYPVVSIVLNKTELELAIDDTETLNATILPTVAGNKNLTWTSSNDKIATVSNGKITGKAIGNAVITAKSNNGKTATCSVKVIDLKGITFDNPSLTIKKNEIATLKLVATPSSAVLKDITYTSSSPDIVLVDDSGKILGLASGSSTITARTKSGKEAKCDVTVKYGIEYNSNVTVRVTRSGVSYIQVPISGVKFKKQTPNDCWNYAMHYGIDILKALGRYNGYVDIGAKKMDDALKIIAQEVEAGRPVVVRIRGKYWGKKNGEDLWERHFMTIIGVREDADIDNLKQSDFFGIDPGTAGKYNMATGNRYLLETRINKGFMGTAGINPGYLLYIFTNASKYITSDNSVYLYN